MPADTPVQVKVEDFAALFRGKLIPINDQFSYFASPAMAEEDVRPYLHEPIAALPPAVCSVLPRVTFVLVPFLEQAGGTSGVRVSYERVALPDQTGVYRIQTKESATIFFSVKEEEISEYHYTFYGEIAAMVARVWTPETRDAFQSIVRGELTEKVSGEIDETSWSMKQGLLRRSGQREKAFRDYARQAFQDTLTLYLHGICCDIDVETGPRQMPSRYVRKRLERLHGLFPPPAGHAVFPEELNRVVR